MEIITIWIVECNEWYEGGSKSLEGFISESQARVKINQMTLNDDWVDGDIEKWDSKTLIARWHCNEKQEDIELHQLNIL
tara:strand:- start:2822 stop:3058 length:237 start_codon:yes stop_codon:yes gene_type:complete